MYITEKVIPNKFMKNSRNVAYLCQLQTVKEKFKKKNQLLGQNELPIWSYQKNHLNHYFVWF